MKIVLIGAGNVAFHLGQLFKKKKHRIVQVYNHSSKGKKLATLLKCEFTSKVEKIDQDADLYVVAIKDEAIAELSAQINFNPSLIVHTSGSSGIDVFPNEFSNAGVLYPLQTFSKNNPTPDVIPFCIEGRNPKTQVQLKKFASGLSKNVYVLDSGKRQVLHMAAVVANNFTNYLFTVSEEILKNEKIPFDMLRPLILETAIKIQKENPEDVQTGPARRGDLSTIIKHMDLLRTNPAFRELYSIMSENISEHYKPILFQSQNSKL